MKGLLGIVCQWKFFPAPINVIFINLWQLDNCILLRMLLYWEMGQEFEQCRQRSTSVLHLLRVHKCELFAAVDNSVDVYVSGSVRTKDWEFVWFQMLGFYSTCKNIQTLQFWDVTVTRLWEKELQQSSWWNIEPKNYGIVISHFTISLDFSHTGKTNLKKKVTSLPTKVCSVFVQNGTKGTVDQVAFGGGGGGHSVF